jgi:hypothetical protein
MTNFILMDAPNFVLLVSTPDVDDWASLGEPEYLNPSFAEIVRLLGVSAGRDELASTVTFIGAAMQAMRQVLTRYGFDLPPLTVGELYGLFEYCDRLDAATGLGMFAPQQLSQWHWMSSQLGLERRYPGRRAIELYALHDARGLRAWHREQGTLAQLGRAYHGVVEG